MAMKRFQLCLERDLDRLLEVEATARRTSKAELIRECVRDRYVRKFPPLEEDPIASIDGLVARGASDVDIDEVVYGPSSGPAGEVARRRGRT